MAAGAVQQGRDPHRRVTPAAWPAGASLPSVTMQVRLLDASMAAAASMCMNGMFLKLDMNFEDTDF